MRTPSVGSDSKRTSYSRRFDLPEDYEDGYSGGMLPIFLNDLHRNNEGDDVVEVTLELEEDKPYVFLSMAPPITVEPAGNGGSFASIAAENIRKKLSKYMKKPWSAASSEVDDQSTRDFPTERERMRTKAMEMNKLVRNKSSAQRALGGLRFISMNNTGKSDGDDELWKKVESRFDALAVEGLLSREHFGACIGMSDSKEFALGVFDALARRRKQKIDKITKDELHQFWLQISDQSFDARLQIFFDMADSDEDGRITRDEVQELLKLSASTNKLSNLKERAEEYASLLMEELDPQDLGYIELWQLETLLLQKERYMDYSRQLSVNWSQNLVAFKPMKNMPCRRISKLKSYTLENWQRGWILLIWLLAMSGLFAWKFLQYRQHSAFQVMGNCLGAAKGAAETLKLNMALVLLPVCRNVLTYLRSTRARLFIPFDDNINFHKIIAVAIAIGVVLHAGIHLSCDFPRLISASPEKFELIASDFDYVKPTYKTIFRSTVVITGIFMVIMMAIAYTLATKYFRKNTLKIPSPLKRLTGFNAFWYSHHLFVLVYILLIVHGTFLLFVHKWSQKTTWVYIAVPLLLYGAERRLRTCRSKHHPVKILKSSVLPGHVLSLIMSKPNGFNYKSGQYIFLQCPNICPFQWHPFSITSAPGDNYLSVHIRTVGDWTHELKRVFTEDIGSSSMIGRAKFGELGDVEQTGLPRLLVDGPYGAPAQYYQNYDVLLLVGLGIGATPFISILKDLLNSSRAEDQTDSNTETSRSEDSLNSLASPSTTVSGKKKSQRTKHAQFYWVTREPGSFEWFKSVMDDVAELDHKGQIEMHNYLTSVYEEGDARSTLITMVQALNHAKHGVDILSGTRVRTHFARPNWKEVFHKLASRYPNSTIGVFYCGMPVLAKELKKLSKELTYKTSTRFEFHKEYF